MLALSFNSIKTGILKYRSLFLHYFLVFLSSTDLVFSSVQSRRSRTARLFYSKGLQPKFHSLKRVDKAVKRFLLVGQCPRTSHQQTYITSWEISLMCVNPYVTPICKSISQLPLLIAKCNASEKSATKGKATIQHHYYFFFLSCCAGVLLSRGVKCLTAKDICVGSITWSMFQEPNWKHIFTRYSHRSLEGASFSGLQKYVWGRTDV